MPSSKKKVQRPWTHFLQRKKPSRKFPVRSRKCSKKNSEKNLVREVAEAAALNLFYAERLWCHVKNSKDKTQSCISCIVIFLSVFPVIVVHFLWFSFPYLGYHQGARTRNRTRPDPVTPQRVPLSPWAPSAVRLEMYAKCTSNACCSQDVCKCCLNLTSAFNLMRQVLNLRLILIWWNIT